jgi:purine-binding chemotaxis protein CheW
MDRAKRLARVPITAEGGGERLEVVEFSLAGERYGIETWWVREVSPLKTYTPLPCTPPFVLGLTNLRGQILSIVDVRQFFDLPHRGLTDLNKVIVLTGEGMEFGILADVIAGVRPVPRAALQPELPTLTGIRAEYLLGVTSEGLVILDGRRLLSDRSLVVHQEVVGS